MQQKFYNIFFISLKQNKKWLLLLIPENIGDRVFIDRKTKIPTVYREKGINKVFQNLTISSVSIFLIDCQSNTFLLMNIIISQIFIKP